MNRTEREKAEASPAHGRTLLVPGGVLNRESGIFYSASSTHPLLLGARLQPRPHPVPADVWMEWFGLTVAWNCFRLPGRLRPWASTETQRPRCRSSRGSETWARPLRSGRAAARPACVEPCLLPAGPLAPRRLPAPPPRSARGAGQRPDSLRAGRTGAQGTASATGACSSRVAPDGFQP